MSVAGINIQDIKPSIDEMESGDFVIQFYDQYGAQTASYAWVLSDDTEDGTPDGWYEEDWATPVVKTFDFGEAFNVMAAKDGGILTYAGQVVSAQTVVPVRKNLSCQGNFRPTTVSIQTIIPAVAEGDEMESGDFVIQFYNQYGAQTASYAWVLSDDTEEGTPDGWYEEDWATLVTYSFNPGEGFNVMAAKDNGTLTFPALDL